MARITSDSKNLLKELLEAFSTKYTEVQVVSVCTSDGFNLRTISDSESDVEPDKLSAIASTLCSISNAAAEQVSKSSLTLTTIESENGRNILLMKTTFSDTDCVICTQATKKMSLAELRFITNTLSKNILKI